MPERVVFVRLKGGLGNQLFQFATAYALARRTGCPLKLEIEYCRRDPIREYELGAFGLDVPLASASDVEHFALDQNWRRALGRKLAKRQTFLRKGHIVEPHFHFAPEVLQLQPPVLLDGYWQSERYFVEFAEDLRSMFARPEEPSPDFLKKKAKIAGLTTTISVHVRRGDYVTGKSAGKTAGSCTPEYYQRAVRHLLNACPGATCVIFSDEPDFAADMLSFAKDRLVIDGDPAKPADDLCLMASCDHHVLANSSFSWWGGWLNPQPGKCVIAPRRWFSRDYLFKHSSYDLYPDNWLALG